MILITVGTQIPFPRLLNSVNEWAKNNKSIDFFAQVGIGGGNFSNLTCQELVSKNQLDELMINAELIISHAGMGTILTALTYGKPIIVMPRKAELNEHRNDHQMATCKALENQPGLYIAWNEKDLIDLLNRNENLINSNSISKYASPSFLEELKKMIN